MTRFVRDHLPEWLVPAADAVTLLGDLALIVGGLALFVVAEARRTRHNSSERVVPDRTAFLVGVVLGGLALTLILKSVLGAPRPPADVQALDRSGYGFPSGHTMAATLLWGALAIWGPWGTQRRRLLGAALIVGLVAVSRLVLGVHYLPDVVASIAIAVAFLWLAGIVFDGDPRRALGSAALLGLVALVVTGANVDGAIAFGGSFGAAAGWWLSRTESPRPAVSRAGG